MTMQVAIQTVEQLRLTLDSRRRSVSALEGACLPPLASPPRLLAMCALAMWCSRPHGHTVKPHDQAALHQQAHICAGDITNLQAKTGNPQDPKLMKYVERKHRQEVKMSRAQPACCDMSCLS
jgi:hypothetical protein